MTEAEFRKKQGRIRMPHAIDIKRAQGFKLSKAEERLHNDLIKEYDTR